MCAGTCHSPVYEMLISEASRLGVHGSVLFTGFISDKELREAYERSTIIVSPSLWEAASGAVFEAFSFEKPVACSPVSPPTVSQVEQAGAYVNFFDPKDPKDILHNPVIEVLDNPEPFIAGSRAGAKYLLSLDWNATATKYMEIFGNLVKGNW